MAQITRTKTSGIGRFFPISSWLPSYNREWLRPDILAGVTLAAFTIPEAMAYAGLAGLPPQSGLYAGIAAPLVYMVLGTSKQLSIGVTSAVSILVASGLAFAADGDPAQYAMLALVNRASQSRLNLLGRVPETLHWEDVRGHPEYRTVPGLMIIRLDEGLFFANATPINEEIEHLLAESDEPIRAVLIDLELTDELDISGTQMLAKLHANLAAKDIRLLFSRVSPDSLALMERSGLTALVGAEHIYPRALAAIANYLEEEDIPIQNVKGMTAVLIRRVSQIYSHLAERADEPQKEQLLLVSESMDHLIEQLDIDQNSDEA